MVSTWVAIGLMGLASLVPEQPRPAAGGLAIDGGRLRFAVIGHTRGGPSNGVIPRERLAELVEDVRRAAPDFVVLTGDLIYGDIDAQWAGPDTPVDRAALEADWEAVDAIFAGFGVPVFRAPGNHDVWEQTSMELWRERYGELWQAFSVGDARFLILNSCWLPPQGTDERLPGRFIRGFQLPEEQVAWLADELEAAADARHAFAFLGHVLWWNEGARWWDEVHPLLAAAPTRAVFAGDLGPGKWSHVQRDGVHYVQSTVEFTDPVLEMLRNREGSRAINAQLDNWVLVDVDGDEVRYEVRALGGMTNERHTPSHHQAVHDFDAGTFAGKLFDKFHSPKKLLDGFLLAGLAGAGGGVLLGAALAILLRRRRAA